MSRAWRCIGQPSGQPPNSFQEKALRRVDPVKADSLALDFEGITVDDPGGAGHIGQGGRGEQAENQYTGQAVDAEIGGHGRRL